MKHFLCTFLLLICALSVSSKGDLQTVIKIADHILQNHNNELTTDDKGHVSIASYYQEWRYVNGVLALSMLDLANETKDKRYCEFVKNNYDFFFNNNINKQLKAEYEKGIRNTGYYRFFSMSSLDDCGAMGAGLSELNKKYPSKQYQDYLKRIANYILKKQERLSDGTFCRGEKGKETIWADDLYMSLSFLTHYGATINDKECFDCAASQVIKFDSLLFDNTTGLYYHCYYNETKQQGVAHWGRANGWTLMAQALLLNYIPVDHPLRKNILTIFKKQVNNIARYQSKNGMWHQLLDKNDSYLETSCTAMFAYAIAKGVNEKWLSKDYASIAIKAWEGICSFITKDSQVENICMGTGISQDLPFYYNRPAPLNDVHGLGAVILAGLEIVKLN